MNVFASKYKCCCQQSVECKSFYLLCKMTETKAEHTILATCLVRCPHLIANWCIDNSLMLEVLGSAAFFPFYFKL